MASDLIETEAKTKETDSLIQILSEKESETEKQTETQKETEQTEKEVMLNNQTEKQTVKGVKVNSETEDQKSSEDENNSKGETQNSQISQSTSRIGEYVTIKTGAHLYDDPYDAVKEQLQRATNGKIVVKTNSADRVYKVTKEGLYCPDGRCVEISNGNLETAMRQAGIDVNILKNIDTEALEKKGYKRMLHVVADGIAQWVEEGDSLQLQVDKFGNRIEKTDTEKQTDQKTSNQQVNDKELELAEETLETK